MALDLLKRSEKPAGAENAITAVEHDANFTAIETEVNSKANTADLAVVATSGSASDLTGDFAGNVVSGNLAATGTATGVLTGADSGKVLRTTANVTIPQTAGFNITLIAGGAHTVTFGATVSPAMAAGDLMSIVVDDQSAIHAVRTPVANKVTFA